MTPLGLLMYEGPSLINGEPVVAVLSGLRNPSSNRKTGPMLQVAILHRDIEPREAARTGADEAICGTCPHRRVSLGTCYVNLVRGPRQMWKSYQAGKYPEYSPRSHDRLLRGQAIRFGSYGDPAAVPLDVWCRLASLARTHTGYTHVWRTCDRAFAELVMASADTPEDRDEAKALGYRTFRVRSADRPVLKGEATCPASDEHQEAGGRKVQCIHCGLCAGASSKGKDVVIVAHGQTRRRFDESVITDLPVLT